MSDAEILELSALTGTETSEPVVRAVHLNKPQGHIGFDYDSQYPAYFTDHGDRRLHLWAGTALTFTPETARDLAAALTEWAEMRGGGDDARTS